MSKERLRELAYQHAEAQGGFGLKDLKKGVSAAHNLVKSTGAVSKGLTYLGHPELAVAAKSLGYGLVPLEGGYYTEINGHIHHVKTKAVKSHVGKNGKEYPGHPAEYKEVHHTEKFLTNANGKHPHYKREGSVPAGYKGHAHSKGNAWNQFVSENYRSQYDSLDASYPEILANREKVLRADTLYDLSIAYQNSKK